MFEPVLVLIKPDGIKRELIGDILSQFSRKGLQFIATRLVKINKKLAKEHYKYHKKSSFYNEMIKYMCGELHNENKVLILICYGENAIQKCREIAGATNPYKASPISIRGAFGRITPKGIFENVVHVSSNFEDAEREIKLWFEPRDILFNLYSTKIKTIKSFKKIIWA